MFESPNGPPAHLVATELSRIEASATFRRSKRHRELLRYLVARTLAGDASFLKESVLAVEVFGRDPAGFDPQKDTTVRVEARRLRHKLRRYYDREAHDSPLTIELAPGHYVPKFEVRADVGDVPRSLIVLPFVNLSGDPGSERWCDALTEELIDALVQFPGLKVVARTTSFSFKGQQLDVRAIACTVGVRALLEGSVQKLSSGFRVVAQLVDGCSGLHVWSHAFATDATDVPRVVYAMARAIMRGLSPGGAAAALEKAEQRMSKDAEACDAWQRGRYLLRRHSREAYVDAGALFDRALARDPSFALAWAGKAKACISLYSLAVRPDPAIAEAAQLAVARALDLDPELSEAHAAAAMLAFTHERNLERAERSALDAIRYAPGSAYVHHNYAWTLMFSGRFDESAQEFAIARDLDPLDPLLRVHQALLSYYRRDFEGAAAAFTRVLEIEPSNIFARVLHASALLCAGEPDCALPRFEAIAADLPADSIGPLGIVQAHAVAGRVQEARAAFTAMVSRFGEGGVGPYRMAIACCRQHDPERAFVWLDRAAEARDLNLVCAGVDPSFDALRDDARWQPALRRYGLPAIDPRPGRMAGLPPIPYRTGSDRAAQGLIAP
jgi:serine/threonine-protein kinase